MCPCVEKVNIYVGAFVGGKFVVVRLETICIISMLSEWP